MKMSSVKMLSHVQGDVVRSPITASQSAANIFDRVVRASIPYLVNSVLFGLLTRYSLHKMPILLNIVLQLQ
jgi:hypothetical protein